MRTGSIHAAALALGLSMSGCADETGSEAGEAESSDATDGSSSDASGGESDTGTADSSSDASDASSDGTTSSSDSADATDTTDGTGSADGTDSGTSDGQPCEYPAGAVEPMALDQVLTAYAWPEAIRADGLTTPLALENAACDDDEVIDWTPRDVIVFISWPAW